MSTVDEQVVSSIGKGICVLVGISVDDNESDIDYMVRKLLTLRVFDEGGVMWKKSVQDMDLELLCGKFQIALKDYMQLAPDSG